MNLLKKISSLKNRKVMYLVFLGIIVLLGVVLSTTYAKFPDGFVTADDIVEINLGFNVDIIDMQEYQEINVKPLTTTRFNVQVTNNSDTTVYYGMWYDMIVPNVLPINGSIEVGKIQGTTGSTSGELEGGGSSAASIAVVNNTNKAIKLYIGINSSTTSTSDIEYLDGKHLITDEITVVDSNDINIVYISVDGEKVNGIPTTGTYTMTSSCTKGSILSWNTVTRTITYESGSKAEDVCILNFTSSTDYVYLNEMPVGSYVKYVGKGGTVGSTAVACKKGGTATDSTLEDTAETEAPNSCLGQNAREDIDTNGNTYGYCYTVLNKYYVTGWRLAYVDSNNKPVIISAGSPECSAKTSSTANATYIATANALALKYCNTEFVDGNCTCTSTTSGQCSSPSTDAWAINDNDFNMITKAITGTTTGGYLYTAISGATICGEMPSKEVCGYNNDLIDNGGYYWFAASHNSSDTYGVYWYPYYRRVSYNAGTYTYGLRPVISLKSSVYVTGGTGTMDAPYEIMVGS